MILDQSLNKILIIDFGSQFTQLIARRIRELGVFSEIISHKKIKNKNIDISIKGIILSGGPLNVYEINRYSFDKEILKNNKYLKEKIGSKSVPLIYREPYIYYEKLRIHTASQRTNNLEIDPEKGLTVEFWMKKDDWAAEDTLKYEYIFYNMK